MRSLKVSLFSIDEKLRNHEEEFDLFLTNLVMFDITYGYYTIGNTLCVNFFNKTNESLFEMTFAKNIFTLSVTDPEDRDQVKHNFNAYNFNNIMDLVNRVLSGDID